MSGRVRRSLALALLGLAAGFGLVAALFWGSPPRDHGPGRPGIGPTAGAPEVRPGSPVGGAPSGSGDAASGPSSRQTAAPAPPGPAAAAAAPEAPRFDIVRVEPSGEAVVAGRGAPNTVVEMLVDGRPVAKALADPTGQFAIVPPALPSGSSAIQLRARTADGDEVRSSQTVAVSVPAGHDQRPLVALTAPDAPTVVLSQPAAGPAEGGSDRTAPTGARGAADAGQPARIVSVDAQENGRLFVTGAAAPGAELRLYLNDTPIAPAVVGSDGRVTFTIGGGIKPGRYLVRIDQIEPGTGKVRSRAEVPFSVPEPLRSAARTGPRAAPAGAGAEPGGRADAARAVAYPHAAGGSGAPRTPATGSGAASPPTDGTATAGAVFVPEIATARISRGDNLWRISQRAYGRGERYTVIFDANQNQIRDPDLIYPGQIFVLPAEKRG